MTRKGRVVLSLMRRAEQRAYKCGLREGFRQGVEVQSEALRCMMKDPYAKILYPVRYFGGCLLADWKPMAVRVPRRKRVAR
jgi:hypothetical protein